MSDRDDAGTRYTAFLSYSHKDAAAAGRLHRRLETYRLPRRLVGTTGARGPVPERLWPIFRDREELPAATDLSETVREALAQSGALIVLCSPHAAGSLWVAEEIRVFREIHRDRPILAAILDGHPPDCFPAALRAFGQDGTWHEPLATDLRPQGDGKQLGLLKLVAGITGVGLDALVQRDAARKIRRVTAVTAVALIAMLIMAALAVVALRARAEAERQRAEAEGLVEFMLTDLRDELRKVGSLHVMEAVNARALSYYNARSDLTELSDESLGLRARILQAIGQDKVSRDDFVAALSVFREAYRTTREQLARAPADPRRMAEHITSNNGIGRVHELRRKWPIAQRYYLASAELGDRLAVAAPNDPAYLLMAASGTVNLGNVAMIGRRDYPTAQRYYERGLLRLARAVARARGEDREHAFLAQANAYGWLADTYFRRCDWPQFLHIRRRQNEVLNTLLRQPRSERDNRDMSYRVAASQRGLAHAYHRTGDDPQARRFLFQAYKTIIELTAYDPRNAQWAFLRLQLTGDLLNLGLGLPRGVTVAQLREDRAAAPHPPPAAPGGPRECWERPTRH